jgi:hypothetical protein
MSGPQDPQGILGDAPHAKALRRLARCQAVLRGHYSRSAVEKASEAATEWEDWLELNNPASALLPELRNVRRQLEERMGRKYNRPTG